MIRVQTGLEQLINSPPSWIFKKKLGLLANPASIDNNYNHARDLINSRFPNQLTTLFSPQHGFFAEKQDNMIESNSIKDPVLQIPVFSLYGETRVPTKKMFENIDILLIDIQDVGTRVYTFIYTISYCLESAKKYGKKVVILDRPNPVNGISIEGNLLLPDFTSFVGRYPIPMRHGLTTGEIALLFNTRFKIKSNLEIIPMKNWKRKQYFNDTGLAWVPPSPNLPTLASTMVYPGQVLFEGTNISEGRGTTMPFEFFGAPFIDTKKILSTLGGNKLPGVTLRTISFEPTFNKWVGTICKGFHIHVTNPELYNSYITTLKIIQAIIINHKENFKWKQPPYEYEFIKLPIDLITGNSKIRLELEKQNDINTVDTMNKLWQQDICIYKEYIREFYLYE